MNRFMTLQLEEDVVSMIQIDGPRRRVYIKFVNDMRMRHTLSKKNGIQDFKHDNGEISQVQTEIAGMGMRTMCVSKLPPEVQDTVFRNALGTYRDITEIAGDLWTQISLQGVKRNMLGDHELETPCTVAYAGSRL